MQQEDEWTAARLAAEPLPGLVGRLRDLRGRGEPGLGRPVLAELRGRPMTKELLRSTDAGKEVNHPSGFWTGHPVLGDEAKALVQSWKASIKVSSASAAGAAAS